MPNCWKAFLKCSYVKTMLVELAKKQLEQADQHLILPICNTVRFYNPTPLWVLAHSHAFHISIAQCWMFSIISKKSLAFKLHLYVSSAVCLANIHGFQNIFECDVLRSHSPCYFVIHSQPFALAVATRSYHLMSVHEGAWHGGSFSVLIEQDTVNLSPSIFGHLTLHKEGSELYAISFYACQY